MYIKYRAPTVLWLSHGTAQYNKYIIKQLDKE